MKMIPLCLFALFFHSSLKASSGEYWVCAPMSSTKKDPRILIARGEGNSLHFQTDRDLIREAGRLPEGRYLGSYSSSSSGFSIFATLDVSDFFPNAQDGSLGTRLSLSLHAKSPLFATEAYLLFPTLSSDTSGEILNNYACKHRL